MVGEEGKLLSTLSFGILGSKFYQKQILGYFLLIRLVIIIPFTECLLRATHCVVMIAMSLQSWCYYLLDTWGNWGSETWSNLPWILCGFSFKAHVWSWRAISCEIRRVWKTRMYQLVSAGLIGGSLRPKAPKSYRLQWLNSTWAEVWRYSTVCLLNWASRFWVTWSQDLWTTA